MHIKLHQNKVCGITVPGMGDFSKLVLEDIALVTGATMIDSLEPDALEKADLNILGSAVKVISGSMDTFFKGGRGD